MGRAREVGEEVWGGSVDLKDGFHQFLNDGVKAGELNLTEVIGEGGQRESVGAGEYIWPAYGGMAMGWSWALWICRETVASIMTDVGSDDDVWVLDKRPVPALPPDGVGWAPYVDNANLVGRKDCVVAAKLDAVKNRLDALGLVWAQEAPLEIEVLGVILDGRRGEIRAKPARSWRSYRGTTALLGMSLVAGWQVRAVLGHYIAFFQLARPFLSVFRATYDFLMAGPMGEYRELPGSVKDELVVAKSLIFVVGGGSLRRPPCPIAYISDASMKGYAIYETGVSAPCLRDLTRYRERSRFATREKFVDREHDGYRGTMAGPGVEPDFVEGIIALPRGRRRPRARDFEEVDLGHVIPPLPDDFVDERRWRLIVAGAWRDAALIHEYEARAAILGLRRSAANVDHHGCGLLSAPDNMSCVCAFD